MNTFIIHPTGNSNVRAIIKALDKTDQLVEFGTTLAVDPSTYWLRLLPSKLRSELLRRTFPVSLKKIWSHPNREIMRLALARLSSNTNVHHKGWASVDTVYGDFDKAASNHLLKMNTNKNVEAVYAYEDGAFNTFTAAKKLGIKCIYDIPIAYWETGRRLMTEEAERLPDWSQTLGGGILDSDEKLERKTRELELADVIVVPGQFVKDSLPIWANKKKIVMSHFGSPKIYGEVTRKTVNKPMRVLFVGSMGQRKGLGDLFNAVKLLNRSDIELVVMGSLLAPLEFYKKELPSFTYEAGRTHDQVLSLMRSCDILCLPSIVEGRALVMQEAMSQGLPLIITPNTGGADLVQEEVTGFMVPIRSSEAIARKLNWFLENRFRIPEMGRMAQKHASQYTWELYGSKVVESII